MIFRADRQNGSAGSQEDLWQFKPIRFASLDPPDAIGGGQVRAVGGRNSPCFIEGAQLAAEGAQVEGRKSRGQSRWRKPPYFSEDAQLAAEGAQVPRKSNAEIRRVSAKVRNFHKALRLVYSTAATANSLATASTCSEEIAG